MLKFKIQNPKSKINPNSKYQNLRHQFCHLSFVIGISFVICALSFVILISGCVTLRDTLWEGAKGIYGVSTKILEDNRKFAIAKTFKYDYPTCYAKTSRILERKGRYIYAEDKEKHMIAIYLSGVPEEDTTPVGLFFKEVDAANTQIEVSSPSTYAKELIATEVFSALDELLAPKKKKEQRLNNLRGCPSVYTYAVYIGFMKGGYNAI